MDTLTLARMSDEQLIEELLVALALTNDTDARVLAAEVQRRGLTERATTRAQQLTTHERRRLGAQETK